MPFCGGGTLTSALRVQPDVILNPDVEVRDIAYPDRICGNSETAFTVQLYNAGQFTGIGTVELYIDGNLAGSTIIDIQPGELLNVPFQVNVPPSGNHQVKAVYEGKFSTRTRTETFEVNDNDCDGWLNEIEEEYGTNPDNPDTDGDGVLDPDDMDPLGNLKVEIDIFRIRGLDALPDSGLGFRIHGKAIEGIDEQNFSKTIFLNQNENDFEKYLPAGESPLSSIQDQVIATIEVDVPDYWDSVTVTFNASIVMSDLSEVPLDISPQPDKREALLYFNVLKGTWSGDDAPNDHNVRYGYGHLSGAGDGSGSYSEGSGGYTEPFSKYYDDLEALGYDLNTVNITSVRGWDDVGEVSYSPGRNKLLKIINPAEVVEFTLSLPDGKEKKVVLVNSRGARVLKFSSSQKVLKFKNIESAPEMTPWDLVREEYTSLISAPNSTLIKLKNSKMSTIMSEPKDVQIAQVYDIDEDDAEIWFLIKMNDEDGIPFYREIELNNELEKQGIKERFDPSDGFWVDDPEFYEGLIQKDAYGDYDGDGVPNAVELFIGKNPTKPDVLGIHLNVSIEWNASEDEIKAFIKSFQRASQVIYDYTDGYAVISGLTIYTSKREWDNADIQVSHDIVLNTSHEYWPNTNAGGGYWVKHYVGETFPVIKVPRKYDPSGQNNESNLVGPTDKEYWRMLGHELGHYLFMFGDEYMTWQGIHYSNVQSELNIELEKIPKTIMYDGNRYSEISYYNSYLEFNNELKTKIGIGWENYTTWQWYRWMGHSSWTSLLILLKYPEMGLNYTGDWEHYIFEKAIIPNLQRLPLHISMENLTIETIKTYTPSTGPYTGVGYYLRVEVNP